MLAVTYLCWVTWFIEGDIAPTAAIAIVFIVFPGASKQLNTHVKCFLSATFIIQENVHCLDDLGFGFIRVTNVRHYHYIKPQLWEGNYLKAWRNRYV